MQAKNTVFSMRFREALKLRRKKQADIVAITGIDRGTMSNYATGRYVPKDEKLRQIAAALNVSDAYLRGLTDNPEPIRTAEDVDRILSELAEPGSAGILVSADDEVALFRKYRAADDDTKQAVMNYFDLTDAQRNLMARFFKETKKEGKS